MSSKMFEQLKKNDDLMIYNIIQGVKDSNT
jgi:hypothetical protein